MTSFSSNSPSHVTRKNRRATLERIEKFISPIYFADVNLHHHVFPPSLNSPHAAHLRVAHYPADRRCRFEDLPPVDEVTVDGVDDERGGVTDIWTPLDSIEGRDFGPTWSTHWFHVIVDIPREWIGQCCVFQFDAGCEAMIWRRESGRGGRGEATPVLGLSEKKTEWTISPSLTDDDVGEMDFFVEMACNTLFGAGKEGFINPPDEQRRFGVKKCRLAVKDRDAYRVFLDLTLLLEIVNALGEENERGFDALYAGNDIINAISRLGFNKCGYDEARRIAGSFFRSPSSPLAAPSSSALHRIHAVGNCHIDTAWLWPYEETERKAGRSFASAVHLMASFPNYKFVASQAVQFQWVKDRYPDVYRKMKIYAAEGRFLPVGGAWVEMDGNMPSGESFCRQFIYGQRFFEAEFGIRCKEFWLPDTFGYSAQLPQIMRAAEMDRFVTQKLSWSLINKFPHNSFLWEGIDGSQVLTHFPPGDSYEMSVKVDEFVRTVKNNKDKGRAKDSLFLFGHGDGGGGPTEEMLHRLNTLSSIPGFPFSVTTSTPEEFFFALDKSVSSSTSSSSLCTWVGELYLELHQGTLTSQASTKKENRRLENLLRLTEFLATIASCQSKIQTNAAVTTGRPFPRTEIDAAWKNVLLNQFHDVLPGTSIGCVYEDVHRLYKQTDDICQSIIRNSLVSIVGRGSADVEVVDVVRELPGSTIFVANSTSFRRREVVSLDDADVLSQAEANSFVNGEALKESASAQPCKKTRLSVADVEPQQIVDVRQLDCPASRQTRQSRLILVDCDALCVSEVVQPVFHFQPVELRDLDEEELSEEDGGDNRGGGGYLLRNSVLSASLTRDGRVRWIRVRGDEQNRNALVDGRLGNEFVIYDDIPLYWDAWDVMDYHLETEKVVERKRIGAEDGEAVGKVVSRGPLRAEVRFSFSISGSSTVTQSVILDAESPFLRFDTRVSWHENRKMLKVQFPINVRSDNATYEIQYGHVQRPTHQNTSWDAAKHEVVGQRWADLSEFGYGVALINDCKYGHSVTHRNVLNLSLLRAPKAPDASCDMSDDHRFSYALMPHLKSFQEAGVIQAAYAFNSPLKVAKLEELIHLDKSIAEPFAKVSSSAVIIDCVSVSHFSSSGVLLRFYECFGSTVSVVVSINDAFKIAVVKEVNLLETEVAEIKRGGGEGGSNNSFQLRFTPFQMKTVIVTLL